MSIFFFLSAIVLGAAIRQGIETLFQQFDFYGHTARTIFLSVVIIWGTFFLCSCAHESITQPTGPGGAIVSTDATGVTFTDQGHALWIAEGVPSQWFIQTPTGWHLTSLLWHQGNAIRMKNRNP